MANMCKSSNKQQQLSKSVKHVKICPSRSNNVKTQQNLSSSVKLSARVQILQDRDRLSELVPSSVENVRRRSAESVKQSKSCQAGSTFSETVQILKTDSFAPNDSERYQNHTETSENTQNIWGCNVVVSACQVCKSRRMRALDSGRARGQRVAEVGARGW